MKRGLVYFIKPIGFPGPIKIGFSDVPTTRLATLACWSPFPLEILVTIPGNAALERNIHECFLDCHSHREWFRAEPRLQSAVAKLADGVPVAEAIDLSDRRGSIKSTRATRVWPEESRATYGVNIRVVGAEKRAARLSGERRFAKPEIGRLIRNWRGVGEMPSALRVLLSELFADPVSATLTEAQMRQEWHALSTPEGE